MRLVIYNPLSLAQAWRLEEISDRKAAVDLIFVIGTQLREREDGAVERGETASHWVWHWGHTTHNTEDRMGGL